MQLSNLSSARNFQAVYRAWNLDAFDLTVFRALVSDVFHDLLILFIIQQLLWGHHVHQTQYFCGNAAHLSHRAVHETWNLKGNWGLVYTRLQMKERGDESEKQEIRSMWPTFSTTTQEGTQYLINIFTLSLTSVVFLEPTLALWTRSFLSPSCIPFSPAMACDSEQCALERLTWVSINSSDTPLAHLLFQPMDKSQLNYFILMDLQIQSMLNSICNICTYM